jgi:hypothetical protein
MTYRSDVDALAARTDALAAEVKSKTRELESARSLLDEAVAKSKLPVLPDIKVATPCMADWNAMTGDERVRACGSCNKNVYNLSTLTREEAESLIVEKEGRLCVRYYQRKDGTILLKDCSIGITQKRKRRVLAAGVVALLGGGVFTAIKLNKPARLSSGAILDLFPSAELIPFEQPPVPEHELIMGGIGPGPDDIEATMGTVAMPLAPLSEGDVLDNGNIVVK